MNGPRTIRELATTTRRAPGSGGQLQRVEGADRVGVEHDRAGVVPRGAGHVHQGVVTGQGAGQLAQIVHVAEAARSLQIEGGGPVPASRWRASTTCRPMRPTPPVTSTDRGSAAIHTEGNGRLGQASKTCRRPLLFKVMDGLDSTSAHRCA